MKEVFLNNSLNMLKRQYNYDNDTLDRVRYGLELLYLAITKISVILLLSIFCKSFKETLLTIIFVNIIRTYAYGLHAKKSWHCYLSSSIAFVLMPILFINIEFSLLQKLFISILSFISFVLYAPADTEKRPLINMKHRRKLKYSTLLVCAIYIVLIFSININEITNLILLSLVIQSILINPFTYKIFDLKYDNYKSYKKDCN